MTAQEPPKNSVIQLYRCACGCEIDLRDSPRQCTKCQRTIAEAAHNNLAMTVTLSNVNSTVPPTTVPDDVADWLGKELGHFKILERLGAGGMGQVFRALDMSLQRYVAVKVLRNSNQNPQSQFANEHLMQEAVAQARVNHENVVTIYFVGRHEENCFLAMELVGLDSLATRLQSGPLPYDLVASIAWEVVTALKESYSMGIIHGDIKPNNILLNEQGRAKLSDFGMSRILDQTDQNRSVGGTPNYLAPELLDGAQPSVQSDMYALGVTLYEMTFGKMPVQLSGTSVVSWRASHLNNALDFPAPLPDNIPSKWIALLEKLLDKEPANRFSNYDLLLQELKLVQPTMSAPARAFPRAIAWFFDFLMISLAMLAFATTFSQIAQLTDGPFSISGTVMAGISVFPLTLHFALLIWWGQSVGRHLMSIRVVNQFGLPPSRTTMFLRETFRLFPLWASLASSNMLGEDSVINAYFSGFIVVFILINCFVAVFNRKRMTLHDFIFKTRVILDTRN